MSSKNKDTRTRILEAAWHLMEDQQGRSASMSEIAKEAGVSRQALYLHFDSRIELIAATVHYVDEVKGLDERLKAFEAATTGIELLEACIEIWGNYIPEIYGLAKVLINTRDSDEAAAMAWDDCMGSLRSACQQTIEKLSQENILAPEWTEKEATEMFMAMISVQNWEQLTVERGWSTKQFVDQTKVLLKRTFVK